MSVTKRDNRVERFVQNACGMPGAHQYMSEIVKVKDWQEYLEHHDDTFFCCGELKFLRAQDWPGNMVRLTIGDWCNERANRKN